MSQKNNQHRNDVLKKNQTKDVKLETPIAKKIQQPNRIKTDKPKFKLTEIQQERTANENLKIINITSETTSKTPVFINVSEILKDK